MAAEHEMLTCDFAAHCPAFEIPDEGALIAGGWVDKAKEALERDGCVLLRTPVVRDDGAGIALQLIDQELLEDAFWSTPRSRVKGNTLTATELPSDRVISAHSEMSYMKSWPRLIAFHCIEPADQGGETTVCSLEAVSRDLNGILSEFKERGVKYRRRFHKRIDVPWQQAFQSDDKDVVSGLCRQIGLHAEWTSSGDLITTHTAQGTVETEEGSSLWFNQAHIFHGSSLPSPVRQALEKTYGLEGLPRSATYGDGTPIGDAVIEEVRNAFAARQERMAWRTGDMLILDNMRFAHGRLPFTGTRQLHVALARQVRNPVRRPLFAEG